MDWASPAKLSDTDLLRRTQALACDERHTTAALVAHLAEIEARQLYLQQGCRSLFTYCTELLHLAEYAAYHRIEAARLASRCPEVLQALERGDIHLGAVRLLAPVLTFENQRQWIAAATHKSKREIQELVAARRPEPDAPASIRRLPRRALRLAPGQPAALPLSARPPQPSAAGPAAVPSQSPAPADPAQAAEPATAAQPTARAQPAAPAEPSAPVQPSSAAHAASPPAGRVAALKFRPAEATPAPAATVVPLAPQRYRVQFTTSAAGHDNLRRAQELLRHRIPGGDIATILEMALDVLVRNLEKRKFAATDRPRLVSAHRPRPAGADRPQPPATVRLQPAALDDAGPAPRVPRPPVAALPATAPWATAPPATALPATAPPATGAARMSRHIPAAVQRQVWRRDGGRCAFVSRDGVRCSERGQLEFDHVRPHADGGAATVDNVRLLCRRHNQYEAQQFFGVWRAETADAPCTDGAG